MPKSVDFVTNLAPHYRSRLWLSLIALPNISFAFYFDTESKSSIRQIDFGADEWVPHKSRLNELVNFRLDGVLFWQKGVVSLANRTQAMITIFLGDMNLVSTWVAALILRLRHRKVAFWGHGIYGNEGPIKKSIRLLFLRLANINFVYGERARNLLIEAGMSPHKIVVIYNSLDYPLHRKLRAQSIQPEYYRDAGVVPDAKCKILIFIGRLTRQKRLEQLLQAVDALNEREPVYKLVLVGDGPEKTNLQSMAKDSGVSAHFHGACYDEEELSCLIANADLCVAPGEVGLTAIHAMAYGTPVCTHNDMTRQMPEVEAIEDGITGCLFDSAQGGLKEAIDSWFKAEKSREEVRAACYRVIDQKYNPEAQCRILSEALENL